MSQNDKVAPQSVEDSSQNEDLSTLVEPNYNTLEDHLDDCDEDDDDDGDSSLKKNESQKAVSAERLKAFNMFVRLFIDENLDRLVPISKQPKEKINAIIMSCQRQFPEFEDRARKRIRTYLKSCRRSIRLREDSNKPTLYQPSSQPPEISHILAQACHNESHEAAKRQRIDADFQKDNRRNRFFSGSSVKKDTISPPFMSASSMNVELTHAEIISIKSLIDGYRQSASFLHRSADELESILKNARTPDVDTPAVKREDNRCPHGELLVSPTLELKRKAEQSLSTSSPTKAVCISSVKKERSSPSKSEFVKEISPSKSIKCDEEISPSKSNKFDGEEQLKKKDDDSKEPDKFDQEQDSTTSIRLLEATRLQSNNESDIAGESQTNTSRKNFNESSHVVESSSDEPLVSSQPSLKQHSYQNDSNEITPVLYIPDMSKPRIDISKPRNDRVLKEKTSQILTHSPIYSKRLQYASAQHNRNLSPIPTSNSSDHRFENERFETHQQRHTEMNGERILHHASMASAQQFRNANSTYHNSHPGHISSSGQSPCSDESSYDLHQKRISQENFYVDAPSPKHSSTNISLYTKPQLSPKLHITQYTGSRSSFEGNLRSQTIVYSPRQTAQQVRYHVGQQSRQNQFNNYSVFNFDSPSPQPYYENRQQHQQQNFHPVLSPQNVSYHSVMSPNHSPLVQDLPRQTHFSDLNRQSHYHDASPHGEYTHFDIHPMHK